jgi:TniQ
VRGEYETNVYKQFKGEESPNRLVVRAKPKDGESYLGFLLRLTELNSYVATAWIRELAHIPVLTRVGMQIDRIARDLPSLARLVHCDVSDLHCLLYQPIRYNYDAPVLGSSHPPHVLRLRRSKLCPKCLQEENYCQKLWDYTAATACPIHHVLLIDECRICRRRITWTRKRVSVCRCGGDFRETEASKIAQKEVEVSALIFKILRGSPNSHKLSNSNPLSNLDLGSVLGALFFVAVHQKTGGQLIQSFTSLTVREAHDAMQDAFRVFKDWPNNFHSFVGEQCSRKGGFVSTNSLFNRYGSFARQLYRVTYLPDSISKILREEFEAYVTEKWKEGRSQAPLWFSNHSGKYVNRRKAAELLNVTPQIIERMVREDKLKGIIVRKKVRKNFSVDAAEVDNLLQIYRRSLSMSEATGLLGLRSGHVMALIRKGGPLKAILIEPEVRIDPESVHRLLRSIVVTNKPCVESKHHYRDFENILGRLSVRLSKYGWGVSDFVDDILSGDLSPRALRSDRVGFHKLQFSASDVTRYQSRKLRTRDDYMMLEDKVPLGFKPATLYFLARRGLIETKRIKQKQNGATRILTRSAVQRFISTHVTASAIARLTGTSIPFAVKTLKALRINPVSGISVDGGPMFIFKKSDVDDARIDSIKTTPRVRFYRNRGALPINSIEVARLLSISEEDVQLLVANDVLRPLGDSTFSPAEYKFNRKIVEGLREQFSIKLTELLSSKAGATLLGMHQAPFRHSCINSGYLEYERSKNGKKRFLRRCNVEKLAEFLKSVVHESQTAALLGTTRSVIERCGRQKLLTVVENPYPKLFLGNTPARLYLRSEIAQVRIIKDPTNRIRKRLIRLEPQSLACRSLKLNVVPNQSPRPNPS